MKHNDSNVHWHLIYKRLANLMFEFAIANSQNVGMKLFQTLTKNDLFLEVNPWVSKLNDVTLNSFDPIQLFASFNGSKMKDQTRIDRINILFRILQNKKVLSQFKSVNFRGCPAPVAIKMISSRSQKEQKEIWEVFLSIMQHDDILSEPNLFGKVSDWYGVNIVSFTQFLFWIDSENYLPLDKNTVELLLKFNKIASPPRDVQGYKKIIENNDKNLFREITLVASERRQKQIYPGNHSRAFQEYFDTGHGESNVFNDLDTFKLIGIRPKTGIPDQLSKVLTKNHLYKFYSNYQFEENDDKVSIDKNFELLYPQKSGPEISLSALVGMNGAGKSTLTELLYISIYNISIKKGLIDDRPIGQLKVDLFFKTDSLYKVKIDGDLITVYKYYRIETGYERPKEMNIDDFNLNRFFYTIAINYSHYGLNSTKFAHDWITPLSHKNDGYQSPVVINPMRTEGDIEINKEQALMNQRFLANILEPVEEEADSSLRNIYDGKKASHIKISLNENKVTLKQEKGLNLAMIRPFIEHDIMAEIERTFKFGDDSAHDRTREVGLAEKYIVRKLFLICDNYKKYGHYLPENNNLPLALKDIPSLIKDVKEDSSHIVFKLKQAIHFLKYRHIKYGEENNRVDIEKLSQKINSIKASGGDKSLKTIHLIPPPIFNCDIILEDGSEFSQISSGENQLIGLSSTIGYHLNNLDSVHDDTGIYSYGNVLVMMDEAELYFHPDLQRRFIAHILDYISLIDLSRIEGINFCFITHSPFLLSDITRTSVLPMGYESETKDLKTFGANVYDILAHSFFFNDGFVGELANRKIKEVIKWLNGEGEWPEYVNSNYSAKLIELIDEPIVQKKLAEMYDKKENKSLKKRILKQQIRKLEEELQSTQE